MGRNRKTRYATVVTRLVPRFRDKQAVGVEAYGMPHEIEGELADYVIVSVPCSESHASAKVLREKLQEALAKPVLIVTHNVEFLLAKKLTPKEGAKFLKEIEEVFDNDATDTSGDRETGILGDEPEADADDGDRPGVGVDGSGGGGGEGGEPSADSGVTLN